MPSSGLGVGEVGGDGALRSRTRAWAGAAARGLAVVRDMGNDLPLLTAVDHPAAAFQGNSSFEEQRIANSTRQRDHRPLRELDHDWSDRSATVVREAGRGLRQAAGNDLP